MKKITLLILFLALGLVSLSCGKISIGGSSDKNADDLQTETKTETPQEKARKIIDEMRAKYPESFSFLYSPQGLSDVRARLEEVSQLDPSYFQPLSGYWRTDEIGRGNSGDFFGVDVSYFHLYPNGTYEVKNCNYQFLGIAKFQYFYYLDPTHVDVLRFYHYNQGTVFKLTWDGTKIAFPLINSFTSYAPMVRLTKAQYDAVQSDADCPP